MTRLSQILHLDDGEFPAVRAAIEARPASKPTQHPKLSAREALAWMRAQDAPVPPTAPPSRDLVEFQTAVACAMHADHATQVDTIAVIDAIAALAADAHTVAMALAPVVALLAEDEPDTGWGVHAEQLAEVAV